LFLDKKYVLITIPFFCFFLGYALCNLVIGNKTYKTPNLMGLSLCEAVKLTSCHQVNIRILSEKESTDVPAGTILSQKPSPGRLIKTHQSIFVVTTKASPITIAPTLLSRSIQDTEKSCLDSHIKLKSYPLEHTFPCNSCIAQIPQPHEPITDKKITVYIAQDKPNMYLMPNLINQPLELVLEFLREYQDKITIYNGSSKLQPPYKDSLHIATQKPLAGSIISLKSPPQIQLQVT